MPALAAGDQVRRPSSTPTSSPRSIRHGPSRIGRRDGAAVGVGVVGDHEVGARLAARWPAPGRSRRAPRGWGRRRWGSPGRARTARRPARAAAKPARANASTTTCPPTPCIGGVGDREVARARPARTSDAARVEVGVEDRVVQRLPARRRAGCAETGPTASMRGGDLGVGGRHDLRRRRRGRPCSRCPAAGCGWRSPSRRPRSRGGGWRRRAPASAAAGAAAARASPAPAMTAAVSRANTSELCRAS